MIKLATNLALALGLALFLALIFYFGAGTVLAGVGAAGWGLLWIVLLRFVNLATDALGWRALFPKDTKPAFSALFRLRWIGEAVNSMLPVAQVGGDVARAQMATRLGVSGSVAGAGVVVDVTMGLATQFIYTLLGVALLIQIRGFGTETRALFAGLLLAAAVIGGFWAAQHLSLFGRLARLAGVVVGGSAWTSVAGSAADLDANVTAIYARHGDLARCAAWRMTRWLMHTGETWLALYFIGRPVSFAAALVLESLSTAIRSGAFAVPGALGVQEGGFVLLGPLVGVSPEVSLSLALVKRVREVLVGVPGLIAWTITEGQSLARLLSRRS